MLYSCIEYDYPLTLVKEKVNNYVKKKETKIIFRWIKFSKSAIVTENL